MPSTKLPKSKDPNDRPQSQESGLEGTLPSIEVVRFGIDDLPDPRGRANKERLSDLLRDNPIMIKDCQEPFTVPINVVRFTHDEAKSQFGDGRSIWEMINRVGTDISYLMDVNPLRVVQIGGCLFSLDNRRLAGLVIGDVDIVRVRWATKDEVQSEFLWRFSTKTDGESVTMEGGTVVAIPKVVHAK